MCRELSRLSISSWPNYNSAQIRKCKEKRTWQKYKNITRRLVYVDLEESA